MGKTKRIIAALTAAIITATSTSLMSVCADNGEVKKSTLQETAEEINEYMRSNGISGYTYVQVNGGTENKLLIVYDGFLDKIQAYVTEKGIDYSLVEYRQSHDDSIVSDKSDEEKTPEKKYAETILEYMHSNSIQGGVSHSTDDKLLTVSYRGNYGEQLKAYIEELGLDENNIKYELEELPEFIAFNVTTVSQPTATTIAVTETKPVTTITMPVVDDPTMQTSVVTVTIMDISGDIVLVKPVDGSPELKSSSKFSLSAKQLPVDINPKVGMKLEITYNGGILETYPAQFGNVQKVTIVSETANDKEAQKPLISEDDILDLSKKGDELTWSDFEKYEFTDIGDGTNIWQFVIKNSGSKLLVIGRNLEEKPEHINCVWGNGAVFDIRTEDLTPWFYDDALVVKGDANCDGQVDLSDAVMIMQALANPNKYGIDGTAEHHLTEQGKLNADMDGDGLTVGDAQAIQRKLLGLDKADSQSIDRSLIANKLFRYEKSADPGIYDDLCDISFGSNGTYFYHIGYYVSSNQDQGTWTISGETLVLTGQYGTNKFRYEDKALVYIAEESDGFSEFNDKSTPKDGEKFILAEEPDYAAINNLSEIVTIKTDYKPIMSDWSGIGILLEFDSKDYSISLRTNDGHFTTWDIAKGSGPIKNAGVTYDIGNSGYIFWTPGGFEFDADYQNEIVIIGEKDGKSVKLGSIIVTPSNNHTLTAVLK